MSVRRHVYFVITWYRRYWTSLFAEHRAWKHINIVVYTRAIPRRNRRNMKKLRWIVAPTDGESYKNCLSFKRVACIAMNLDYNTFALLLHSRFMVRFWEETFCLFLLYFEAQILIYLIKRRVYMLFMTVRNV